LVGRNPPSRKPGAASSALAWRLWRDYLGRYSGKLALALAAMAAFAASAAAIPAAVEWINSSLSGGPASLAAAALWGPLVVLGLGLVHAGTQYAQARLTASAALAALRDLQNDMFSRLLVVDDAQLRAFGAGQTIARLTNDATVLRETLTRALTAVRDGLTLLALGGVMIWYDWALFAVVMAIYAALGWPVARIGARLRQSSSRAQAQSGDIASLAAEAVAGGRLIRTYNLEDEIARRGRREFEARLRTLRRMAQLRALSEPFIFAVGALALAIVIGVVALRIRSGALDVPEFISFIIALLMLSQPARGLSTLNAVAQEGFAAFERMLALIDCAPKIADAPGAAPLQVTAGAVSFRDVSFSYDGVNAALDHFSLDIPAGKTVALVGESGAGKSTLFNLLTRLYEPQSGAVVIDGQRLGDVTLASLRAKIALVSQETILFNDTVAANIAFGDPGAPREAVVAAAKAAAADSFIRALPNGYETIVGEGGGVLSGGQRQRVAIARAFLKNAPILLLDEATSALDAESERLIQEALARLAKGRTTLVIAHRLATIRAADLIVAMDRGRIVESGAHEAMLAKGGYYARVARLQFEGA
jgi:subfamily B ATP-binding cassette protein MsbA